MKIIHTIISIMLVAGNVRANDGFTVSVTADMENNFLNPPDSARPSVYWYFLDGNLNGKEMTADLESMKAAGLGNLVFLEVDTNRTRRWFRQVC